MASALGEHQILSDGDPSAIEAVKLWERGVSKEKDGSMMDAIQFYRKALKMNEHVEKVYRQKVRTEIEISKKLQEVNISQKDPDFDSECNAEDGSEGNGELQPCWILDMLPTDLLLHIVREVVLTSGESWVNLSLTCSAFNKLCFHNSTPYKAFATLIYPLQRYDEVSMTLNGMSSAQQVEELFWKDDYPRMINERPYIKFRGIYISVVNYLRHGMNPEGSLSLIRPVHMITYYRYFRFYPDGTCLRCLTTDEPSAVVKNYHKGNYVKDSHICQWALSLDDNFGRLTIRRHDDKYHFTEELQIKNQALRKHHRLTWISSSATDKEGNRADFSLKNEKPFFFSRVKSYHDDSLAMSAHSD